MSLDSTGISDTRSQGSTDLQSLITCLDQGDIVAQYAVMQGCVRLRDGIEAHLRGCIYNYGM